MVSRKYRLQSINAGLIWVVACAVRYICGCIARSRVVLREVTTISLVVYLGIGAVYPVIAIEQAFVGSHTFIGIDHGLDWWKNKYPNDFAAYEYLKGVRDELPQSQRIKHIVEGEEKVTLTHLDFRFSSVGRPS